MDSVSYEPPAGQSVPISSGDLQSWGMVEVGNRFFATYGGQGQQIKYGMVIDKTSLLQTADLGVILADPADTNWYCHNVESDGTTARVLIDVDGSVATYGLVTESTTTTPLPTMTYDFGEDIANEPTVSYGGGRWLCVVAATADRSRLLCMGDGLTGVIQLQLPVSLRSGELYRQLLWDGRNNRWLFSTTSDDVVSREMYLFSLKGLYG